MIATTEPVVIMPQSELDAIINAAAEEAVRKAMASIKPAGNRPVSVTISQAAKMIGRSAPTVRKMVRAGTFRMNNLGQIPVDQIDQVLQCSDNSPKNSHASRKCS